MKYLKWLWNYTFGVRFNTLIRVFIGLCQVGLGLLTVWLSKEFIDVTIISGSNDDILFMVILLAGLVVTGILLRQIYFFLSVKANTHFCNSLRLKMFEGLFSLKLYSKDKIHSGDATSRMMTDIDLTGKVATDTIPQILVVGFQLVGSFFLLRHFDSRLAWLLILLTPLAVGAGKFISYRLKSLTHEIRSSESHIQMKVQETAEQNAVFRTLCSELWLLKGLDENQNILKHNVFKRAKFTVVVRVILGLCFGLGYLAAFVYGGLKLRTGEISFGVMTSFLQLVGMIQSPVFSLLNMFPQVIQSTASIDRILEITENLNGREKVLSAVKNESVGLRFQNVSFSYPDSEDLVLKNFTCDFPPNSKTALMGHTGIGKTTIFRLILSLIKPNDGEILFYGDGFKECVSENLMANFVFVPQGNTLVSGSIRYNLQLADPEASDEEMKKVLHSACADFVFDFKDSLDTELTEKGGGLSEGQAQRIAIARGLLRPGRILLLDEISSSLDSETEEVLFERLFKEYPERTMIFITHRKAVCSHCDNVVEL